MVSPPQASATKKKARKAKHEDDEDYAEKQEAEEAEEEDEADEGGRKRSMSGRTKSPYFESKDDPNLNPNCTERRSPVLSQGRP